MREIWETLFGNALLKIDRANKHIADVEERLRTSSDTNGPRFYINSNTGQMYLDYRPTDRELRSDIALIVGDAVHNLRCALDIAWGGAVQIAKPDAPLSKHLKFPIDPEGTREKLESTLLKSTKIPASSALLGLILDGVKPYAGGDSDILAIHALDIDDKHRLLIPMVTIVGVKGVELENEDGTVDRFDILIKDRVGSYQRSVPMECKIKNHGETRFDVTFSEGTLLEGLEVVPTLCRFAAKVGAIVRRLQRMA